ncbi:MAG: hypothetical protein ACJA2S_000981 [Cyclobacteriaceae bacterium]|jgi:hypothetical protein
MLEKILLIVFGTVLGYFSRIIFDQSSIRKKKKNAKNLLLAELSSVKQALPGLLNSFKSNFGMMISANYTNSPIESGSFEDVRQDLLNLDQEQLKTLISFYRSLQYCQDQFEKIHAIEDIGQKNMIGRLINDSLEDIQNKLQSVEKLLSS